MLRSFFIMVSIFTVFLLSGCNGPGADAYYRGNEAYEQGDYQNAFKHYLYAANQDIIPAQYAVGYLYFYGQGTKRDEPIGIQWMERAAHSSEKAQYALYLIQENRPPQPWIFNLKDAMQPKVTTTKTVTHYNHNACTISVQCIKK
jgi:TPR repeat protein